MMKVNLNLIGYWMQSKMQQLGVEVLVNAG